MPAPGDQYRVTNGIGANPFEERPLRLNEYTAQEIATLQSRLSKQLGPEYISQRQGAGGAKVSYLAAEKAINLANEIFGFNGWSSEIKNVQIDFVDESQSTGKISLGLSTIVRVTLKDGTHHEDIGYGHIENCKGKAAAFEKAKKEAATDAMKRALRNFGNILGNCLYDKEYLKRVEKIKVQPSKWDAENLHRHPDFAPAPAPVKEPTTRPPSPEKEAKVARVSSLQSNVSNGTEFGEEFGGDVFDEVDFSESHIDQTMNDSAYVSEMQELRAAPQMPKAIQRVHTLPALRQPSPVQPPQQGQQTRPTVQQRPPQTPNGQNARPQVNVGRIPPPPNDAPQFPRPQQQQPGPQPQNQNNSSNSLPPTRSNSSAPESAPQTNDPNPPDANAQPTNAPPIGFITGRAAELLQKTEANGPVPIPPNVPAFNPHAESPSLRRTSGINHKTSAPVPRDIAKLGAAVLINATIQQDGGQPKPLAPFQTPARRLVVALAMADRDAGRRRAESASESDIVQAAGACGRKRPPEVMAGARPPLADVSNLPADGGGGGVEAKRARVEGA
ncbi:DNA repair protein rad52 [Coniosporium tulheliwenetii]|uniref:DNA repair protein rad52 n=1 Tax=Coniosporium tulheliwenetii TaxID=3383036 RepID=A0ACC2Z4R8_9PEZI|nr:DNA repair protein rad52 [Cladosporium sp. JES 115]